MRKVLLSPLFAEILAVGIPESTFMNANFDEAVEVPPNKRSSVEASFGCIAPEVICQSSDAAPLQSVHVGEEAPEIRQSPVVVVEAAATIPVVSVP